METEVHQEQASKLFPNKAKTNTCETCRKVPIYVPVAYIKECYSLAERSKTSPAKEFFNALEVGLAARAKGGSDV